MKDKKKLYSLIAAAVIVAAGLVTWRVTATRSLPYDEPIANTDANVGTALGVTTPPVNMTEAERQQAELRDRKRLNDIRSLQAALEAYTKDSDTYPDELLDLVPKYLEGLPGNPVPGGIMYTYTPIGGSPYSYYDLSYVLEIGVDGVSIGEHTASPQGIATP